MSHTATRSNHGGARPNAGRKKLINKVPVTIYLPLDEVEKRGRNAVLDMLYNIWCNETGRPRTEYPQ